MKYLELLCCLKEFSDAKVHISSHMQVCLFVCLFHIQNLGFSHTNLASTRFLQKQSSFDKIDRSLHVLNIQGDV